MVLFWGDLEESNRGLGLLWWLGFWVLFWNLGFREGGGVLGGRGFGVLVGLRGPDLRKSESSKLDLGREEEERPIEDAKEATSDLMRSVSLGFRDLGAFEIAIL